MVGFLFKGYVFALANNYAVWYNIVMRTPIKVFSKETGNANNYRIPSLVRLNDGSLVASADERFYTASDNPNRIEKVVRISNDNGITWGKQITAVATLGDDKQHSSAAVDPATLYDDATNTIFMLYSFTPAGIGILNCGAGSGLIEGKQKVVKGLCNYVVENGELTHKGKSVGVKVDEAGNLSCGGNLFTATSPYKAYGTSYLMLTKSTDGGNSWSAPICLDAMVKSKRMHFLGSGPANGIKIKEGKYAGRLVFPVYYGLTKWPMSLTCAVIWSDDNGKTWEIGATPEIDGRFPKKNPWIIPDPLMTTESQVVELPGGDLAVFMRNHNKKRRILRAVSKNGGASWEKPEFIEDLPHCICQITAIGFEYEGKYIIACINASDTKKRVNGKLKISLDEGKTFPYSYTITEGEFVYSSAVYLGNGDIAVLYEDNTKHEDIKFTVINLKEVIK